MKICIPAFIYRLIAGIIVFCSFHASAIRTLDFAGRQYTLSDNTVLLDREGLTGCPEAVASPEEAFRLIDAFHGNAVLLVTPSVYWLDDPDDPRIREDKGGTPFAVRLSCDSLSIIGLSDDPNDVVFAVNRGQTQGAVGNFTMFHFSGRSLNVEGITFGNYCNADLVYPRDPKQNRLKRKDAIVQAQIGICDGTDRLFAKNCRFISRLNLCPFIGARRSLYDHCYFECTDDALSGSAVYLDCSFTFFSSKPFYSTAETGAVFLNCDITCLGKGIQYFTKVPDLVTAIDTRFHSDNPIEIKWTRDPSDVICFQENISLNGSPYFIDASRPSLSVSLADSPLRKAYKIEHKGKSLYNLPNLLNGLDGWDPEGLNAEISAIESETGLRLTGIPVTLRMEVEAPDPFQDGDLASVRAVPLLWGGFEAGKPEEFSFRAQNSQPIEKKVEIPASYPEGLSARHTVTISPKLREAPRFKKAPVLKYDRDSGKFRVDYALTGKGVDRSLIRWFRVDIVDSKPEVFELVHAYAPEGREYSANAADFGADIIAVVTPAYADSKSGLDASSSFTTVTDLSMVSEFPETRLSTDFSDISIVERLPGVPGVWSFDVFKPLDTAHVDWEAAEGPGWYYGGGFDASTGIGMVQNAKGARMSYIPARDSSKNMEVSLVAEPAKSGGQGFGSATSQYMDICVKFDPVSLDGYALRIERTPDHDRAVSFSLVKYEKGHTSVISKEVISDCYRNPCHISVGISDGVLRASSYTEAPVPDRKCCEDVVDRVDLSAPVEDSTLSGFCIQHTGSWGPSSTLLRDLSIAWD